MVLENLKWLLDEALPPGFAQQKARLSGIYAFQGHDAQSNMGAFHRHMRALSVGGQFTYSSGLSPAQRLSLLRTLSHELGHALMFGDRGPQASELRQFAIRQTPWAPIFLNNPSPDLLSPAFLTPFPHSSKLLKTASSYAAQNFHEWFAEAFSATLIRKLEKQGKLSLSRNDKTLFSRLPAEVEEWMLTLIDRP